MRPLRGYAPYIGGFGVSFCVVLSAGLLLMALRGHDWRTRLGAAWRAFAVLWLAGWGWALCALDPSGGAHLERDPDPG